MQQDTKIRVVLAIPAVGVARLFRYVIPSLHHLHTLRDKYHTSVAINLQQCGEGDALTVRRAVTDKGFPCRVSLNTYPKPASMCKVREDTARLCKGDVYLAVDDDFIFQRANTYGDSGARYAQGVDHLRDNPRCGGVLCKGVNFMTRRWKNPVEVRPIWDYLYWTSCGMLTRSGRHMRRQWCMVPEMYCTCPGGLEESAIVYARLELGYHWCASYNHPTVHRSTPVRDETVTDPTDIHSRSATMGPAGVGGVIRARFNAPNWTPEIKRIPDELTARYVRNGGMCSLYYHTHKVFKKFLTT